MNQIALNVDCMEYMQALPDKAFDLAIVDPPYGISIHDSGRLKNTMPLKQDGTMRLQVMCILAN